MRSTNPMGGPTAWSQAQLPGAPIDRNLFGISCPSTGFCVTGNLGAFSSKSSHRRLSASGPERR